MAIILDKRNSFGIRSCFYVFFMAFQCFFLFILSRFCCSLCDGSTNNICVSPIDAFRCHRKVKREHKKKAEKKCRKILLFSILVWRREKSNENKCIIYEYLVSKKLCDRLCQFIVTSNRIRIRFSLLRFTSKATLNSLEKRRNRIKV